MDRLAIFWILIGASTIAFLAGCYVIASVWARGRRTAKGGLFKSLLHNVRVRGVGRTISVALLDGLLHRKLFAEDKFRWAAHTSLSLGFLLLFGLSIFTGFFDEILHKGFGVSTPFVLAIVDKDTPAMAVLNEAIGLVLLVGFVLVAVRRYALRPAQLRDSGTDHAILVLLGIGLLTAYPTEAFRFLMESTPPSVGWYSFIGYPLAQVLKPLALPWAAWHTALFMAHVLPFMALLVYMPFSKFLHVAVSPIVASVNALREEPTR